MFQAISGALQAGLRARGARELLSRRGRVPFFSTKMKGENVAAFAWPELRKTIMERMKYGIGPQARGRIRGGLITAARGEHERQLPLIRQAAQRLVNQRQLGSSPIGARFMYEAERDSQRDLRDQLMGLPGQLEGMDQAAIERAMQAAGGYRGTTAASYTAQRRQRMAGQTALKLGQWKMITDFIDSVMRGVGAAKGTGGGGGGG